MEGWWGLQNEFNWAPCPLPAPPSPRTHCSLPLTLQALWLPHGPMVPRQIAKENRSPGSLPFFHCQAFLPGGIAVPRGQATDLPPSRELSSHPPSSLLPGTYHDVYRR